MSSWCVVVLAMLAIDPTVFEKDGVRIEVTVVTQIYTWTVTNVDAPTITGFEVGHHNTYKPEVPEGWIEESTGEAFRATAEFDRLGIARGRSAEFSNRVSSSGAVLGLVPARVQLAGGTEVVFDGVWGSVPEPASIRVVIVSTIAAIALLHALALSRRKQTPATS